MMLLTTLLYVDAVYDRGIIWPRSTFMAHVGNSKAGDSPKE
jgi:hypothetical protein